MGSAKLATELDGTQPSDIPDDVFYAAGVTPAQLQQIRKLPPTQLSSLIPLVLTVGKRKAKDIAERVPFDFEVNEHGERRCVYTSGSGIRCTKYGTKNIPLCDAHIESATMLSTYFRSARLRETYNRFMSDKEKMRCDSELALMRTMLAAFLDRVNDDNLNLEVIAGVTAMCDKITVVADRMAKLEKVTPEQLNILMARMVEVASKYVPQDRLEEFAKEVEAINVSNAEPVSVGPYLPGEVVESKPATLETLTVKRALVEVAQHMGVTNGDA